MAISDSPTLHRLTRHDLSGRRFGRLTVTEQCERRERWAMYWLCVCDCGQSKWVFNGSLTSGRTTSCGCLREEVRRRVRVSGAMQNGKFTREYTIWHGMKNRCTDPSNNRYARYGGRGIKVCAEWMGSFEIFLRDMGRSPPGASIDRIDNDGDYCPENCRWATSEQQIRNKSTTHLITFAGKSLCVAEWAREIGISPTTLHRRLKTWPLEKALAARTPEEVASSPL